MQSHPLHEAPLRLLAVEIGEVDGVVQEVGRGQGQAHPSPHLIRSPKEALMRLSIGANRKPRYSTIDNARLATKLDLELCAQRCPSFHSLKTFVTELLH